MELNGTIKPKTALSGTMNQTQTLSGTMSRSGGGAGVTEVFWAIYGTTTASEIRLAAEANKLVVCEHDGKIFYLGDVTISSVWFVNLSNRGTRVTTLRCLGNSWESWTDDKTEDMVVVTFGQINLDDDGTISTSTVTANKTAEALFTAHQSGKDVVGFAPVYVHDSLHGTNTAGYYVQFAMTSWEQPEVDDPQNVVSFTGVFPPTETDSLVGVSGGRITLTAKTGYTFSVSLDYGAPAFFTSDMKTKLANLNPYTSNPAMDGAASPGNSSAYARGNHVHPHDTSKLDAPSGGSVGQVLKKTANGTEWANEAGSTITVDSALSNSSENPVQNKVVKAALDTKADSASIEQTIEDAVDDWLTTQAPSIGTLSYAAKQALLACFRKVAWIDDQGQNYYDALESELFPDAALESISAVFTQGQAVIYDTDSLDTLKQYLVVTATYSDSTTATVTSYTLSGTLTVGTSTITVSYGGKTDTFTVSVTHAAQDTTAQILRSGRVLGHFSSQPYYQDMLRANGGVTVIYSMNQPTTSLYPAGILATSGNTMVASDGAACIYILDDQDNVVNYVNVTQSTNYTRWAQLVENPMSEYSQQWTVSQYSKIQFSVDTRYLDDSYMYDVTTGQVWFAGVNTPYYGMSNISEASS